MYLKETRLWDKNFVAKRVGDRQASNGKIEIRDAKGKSKGKYDPKTDTTRDHQGKSVGKGNLLALLISDLG